MSNRKISTARMAKLAMMIALSCALVLLIRIPFPLQPSYKYDPADIPIFITTFAFGPMAGLIVTAIASFLQAFILGEDGIIGFIMHFLATGAFVIVAGLLYGHKKTKKEAIIALVAGVITMTVVMCVANLIISPIYWGVPRDAVLAMMIPVIIPFNLMKSGINALITFFIYKRVSGFLHKE